MRRPDPFDKLRAGSLAALGMTQAQPSGERQPADSRCQELRESVVYIYSFQGRTVIIFQEIWFSARMLGTELHYITEADISKFVEWRNTIS